MKFSTCLAGLLTAGLSIVHAESPETAGSYLHGCLSGKKVPAVWPSAPGYEDLAEPFNLRLAYKPAVIVLPEHTKHVQDAVICASKCEYKVQAKSGGHSYASFSSGGRDGSMMISLKKLQFITIDSLNPSLAHIGGGVRIGNLADGLYSHSPSPRALPHGTCPGVGIGGHFTHGGYGHTSRKWGLAMDRIVSLEVVLANGTAVQASESQNTDVWWAVRGAAESIGIVTRFTLKTEEAPEAVTYFQFKWEGMFEEGGREEFVRHFLHVQDFARNASVVDERISFGIYLDGTQYNLGGTFFGTVSNFQSKIQPEFLRSLRAPAAITVKSYPWYDYLVLMSDKDSIKEPLSGYDEHDNFFAKSITVPEENGLSAESLGEMFDYITAGSPTPFFVIINLYGGPGSAINKPVDAAYADRHSLWVLQLYGQSNPSINDGNASIPFITGLTSAIVNAAPNTRFGAYLNYVDPSLSAKEAHELYYGQEIYERLVGVKRDVDPEMVFWHPQAVGVE